MSSSLRHVAILTALLSCGACRANDPEPRFVKEPREPAAKQAPPAAPAQPAQLAQAPKAVAPNAPPARSVQPVPTSPDPLKGKFTLAQALAGLPKKGALHASIETSLGNIDCRLYEDKAPITVANFVGLARGLRPFWDGRAGAWVKRPTYDGTTFHRAIPDFVIQGGDHMGDGTGDVGYVIPDELWPGSNHDRAGLLCMANKGPNTNGGQFFITDAAAPHLTQMKSYTIFGECTPVDVIHKIARAPRPFAGSERPEPPVPINKVTISRR